MIKMILTVEGEIQSSKICNESVDRHRICQVFRVRSTYDCLEINTSGENYDNGDDAQEDSQRAGDNRSRFQTVAAAAR